MKLQRRLFKEGTLVSVNNMLIATKPSTHGVLLTLTNQTTHEDFNIEQRFLTTTCEYHLSNGLMIVHHFAKIPATIEFSEGTYKQDKNCIHYQKSQSCLDNENPHVLFNVDYETLEALGVLIVLDQIIQFN